MKIREGFVSNSSSTSFCIYGVRVDRDDEVENLEMLAGDMGLPYYHDPEDGIYIGRDWSTIGDDETGKQFKETTQEKIDKLPIGNKHCGTIEEAWYDG